MFCKLFLFLQNDQRERIYKNARDITILAKRNIFVLHRLKHSGNVGDDAENAKLLEQADANFKEICTFIDLIHKELSEKEENYQKYWSKFTFGLQEFIEAYSFYHYVQYKQLVSKQQLDSAMQQYQVSFTISWVDYALGILDLGGELMRLATNHVASNRQLPFQVKDFLQHMYMACMQWHCKDVTSKLEVLRQSVVKVENLCYFSIIQRAENIDMVRVPEQQDDVAAVEV